MSSYYDDFESPFNIYEKWTKGAKTMKGVESENKKGHDEPSYDDPAPGDVGDTPRTDALIEQWMRSPTPITDAAVVSAEYIRREMDYYEHKFVLADVARDLERDRARLVAALKIIASNYSDGQTLSGTNCADIAHGVLRDLGEL